MANKPQYSGLLEQYGLPSVSEEELLAARTQKRLQNVGVAAKEAGQRGPRKEQDFRYIGQLLGGALGIKLNPSKLTATEAKQHEAVAKAQTEYESDVAAMPEIASDPIQAELTYQTKLAEALIQTGQYDKAVPMFAQVEQKRRAYDKQKKELKKLDIDIAGSEQIQDLRDLQIAQARRGQFVTVYPKGSHNENSGVDMYIDPETGAAVKYDKEGTVTTEMAPGSFTTARPASPAKGRAGKTMTLQDYGIGSIEARELRGSIQAAREQMEGAEHMRQILADSAASGSPGINIMGTQGSLTTTYTRMIDTLQGVAGQIGGAIRLTDGTAKGGDLGTESAARKYFKDNESDIEKELAQFLPDNIRQDSIEAERYYAAMIRLTNARMRAVEPGARQLSDEDFKRAMRETAGATTNPEAFRHIMIGNVMANARNAMDRFDWLPEVVDRGMIASPREMQEFKMQLDDFEEAFSLPFGTSRNPDVGITGQPTAPTGEPAAPVDMGDLDSYYGIPKED